MPGAYALLDVEVAVLGNQSMTATELTVAIMEAGYDTTTMPRSVLRDAVGTLMRKDERFKKDGEKWARGN